MPIGHRESFYGVIDPVLCWELWYRFGSLTKVSEELGKRGIINPLKGRPPNPMSIRSACWRYAGNHPEEVRKRWYEPALLDQGIICTDKMWYEELYRQMKFLCMYVPKKFARWLNEHPEVQPYANVPTRKGKWDGPLSGEV